jgi:hypothetical protein
MAVSRQVTTPSITGRDAAFWMRSGYFDDCQSRSHERVAETHEFRRRVGQLLVDGCSGGRGRGIGGCDGRRPCQWLVRGGRRPCQWLVRGGRRGIRAHLGSDRVTSHHHMM